MNMTTATATIVDSKKEIYDYIGIGFGPSNLATCIAIQEENNLLKGMFFEKKQLFSWHDNMLLPGTTMQVHYMKDLVSMRDPTNKYSFTNFLKQQGRLEKFVNIRSFSPYRIEFNEYLSWAANFFNSITQYGALIVNIRAIKNKYSNYYDILEVSAKNQTTEQVSKYLTRSIILSPGLKAITPDFLGESKNNKIFHSSMFKNSVDTYYTDKSAKNRFAVIGSGQSAAEIVEYLHAQYPQSSVTSIQRGLAFKPADDSVYVNEIFFFDKTDLNYNADNAFRQELINRYKDTNYGVVDIDLISKLYSIQYGEDLLNQSRLFIQPHLEVNDVSDHNDQVRITATKLDTNTPYQQDFSGVFLATGYAPDTSLLNGINEFVSVDANNMPITSRDYQLSTHSNDFTAGVWLQGMTEHSHGLSDSLLSVIAIRAGEIAKSVNQFLEAQNSNTGLHNHA